MMSSGAWIHARWQPDARGATLMAMRVDGTIPTQPDSDERSEMVQPVHESTRPRRKRTRKPVFRSCAAGFFAVPLAMALAMHALPADGMQTQQAAANEDRVITAGVYVSPPFVDESGGRYSGMAIDLWEEIATRRGLQTRYRAYPTFRALIDAVAEGKADVAVTNLTITQERARRLSFTQPWYDAGLRIMVPDSQYAGFRGFIEGLRRSGHLLAYAWLLGIIIAATLIVTLFDRKFDKEFPRRWRDGVAESFFHVMSIATAGKASRKNLFGWVGRLWAGIWLAFGVAVVAYITSSVTSVMTTVSLTQQVNSIDDLAGRTVGVFAGSVAEGYATRRGLRVVAYDGIADAVEALGGDEIFAIIGDAPVLEYYAHSHPGEPVSVVGNLFHPDKYGFATRRDSDLTRPMTLELLGLHETGHVKALQIRYFGHTP